tara:strand:- start:143 stop:412 length:270 start_codon:yes stop_codon:yes gene_type:complete
MLDLDLAALGPVMAPSFGAVEAAEIPVEYFGDSIYSTRIPGSSFIRLAGDSVSLTGLGPILPTIIHSGAYLAERGKSFRVINDFSSSFE